MQLLLLWILSQEFLYKGGHILGEQSIMELFKWFTRLLSLLIIMAVFIFGIQVGEGTSYKNQVNHYIERYGGLTNQAIQELNTYSNEYYGGRFRIESPQINQSATFGEVVDYKIIGKFNPVYFSVGEIEIPWSGQAVSLVRP